MEHGLALSPSAIEIAWLAVHPNGRDVSGDRPPPPDLARIVGGPPPRVVTAVPLEPASVAAKHSECKHLLRRELRTELREKFRPVDSIR